MPHHTIAKHLVLIGALNWGLVGVTVLLEDYFGVGSRFDVIEFIGVDLLGFPPLMILVYILTGVAAVIVGFSVFNRSV